MRPVILLSVFLVVTYYREALSEELVRQQPSNDFVKLTSSRKQIAKRRFRRDVQSTYKDDPDTVNANEEEGACENPTFQAGHGINKMHVSKLTRPLFIDEDSKIAIFSAFLSNVDGSFYFLLVGV